MGTEEVLLVELAGCARYRAERVLRVVESQKQGGTAKGMPFRPCVMDERAFQFYGQVSYGVCVDRPSVVEERRT